MPVPPAKPAPHIYAVWHLVLHSHCSWVGTLTPSRGYSLFPLKLLLKVGIASEVQRYQETCPQPTAAGGRQRTRTQATWLPSPQLSPQGQCGPYPNTGPHFQTSAASGVVSSHLHPRQAGWDLAHTCCPHPGSGQKPRAVTARLHCTLASQEALPCTSPGLLSDPGKLLFLSRS